ncbi:MAG: PAS domain S-box protein [Rectinemataceae bacterium]
MSGEKKTILLVEDEAIIALSEKTKLGKYGYDVIISNTGEEAVRTCRENSDVDLILMDIDLGKGMGGAEAAEAILKERDIPVVFLSSHTEPEIVEKTEKTTSYGYVVKSSSMTVLDASIKMAFRLFTAYQEIYERNQLLENIMEAFPGSVFWKDRNYVYLGCNTNDAIDAGKTSPDEVIGKTDYELYGDKNVADTYRNFDRIVMESGSPVLHIEENHRKGIDGPIYYESNKVPLFDNKGRVSGIFGVSINITDRKKLEEKLTTSNEMLQKILDSIPQFIAWKARDSVFLGCNKNYAEMVGLPDTRSIIGKTDWDLPWKDEETENFLKDDACVMDSDTAKHHIIESAFDAEGRQRWLATNKVPLHDVNGKVNGILVAFSDITERWQAERALIENEELYRSIVDASPDGISIADLDGRILTVSPMVLRMFGYAEDELLGRRITDFVVPEDRERALANISFMSQGVPKGPAEYEGIRKDGTAVSIEVNAGLIRNVEAEPGKMVFVIRDITRQKPAERSMDIN